MWIVASVTDILFIAYHSIAKCNTSDYLLVEFMSLLVTILLIYIEFLYICEKGYFFYVVMFFFCTLELESFIFILRVY